jgi:hypothetical protein
LYGNSAKKIFLKNRKILYIFHKKGLKIENFENFGKVKNKEKIDILAFFRNFLFFWKMRKKSKSAKTAIFALFAFFEK